MATAILRAAPWRRVGRVAVLGGVTTLHMSRASSSTSTAAPRHALRFVAEAAYLPEPSKVAKGSVGEDAHFTHSLAVGVADGVGGYAELGIDSGLYARHMMTKVAEHVADADLDADASQATPDFIAEPMRALDAAYSSVLSQEVGGASTAIVAAAGERGNIRIVNVGDSGASLWRFSRGSAGLHGPSMMSVSEAMKCWSCEQATKPQQHTFNTPFQLEAYRGGDLPQDGNVYTWTPELGDVLILATDGMLDNLSTADIHAELAKLDMRACTTLVRMRKVVARTSAPAAPAGGGTVLEERKFLGVVNEVYTQAEVLEQEKACRASMRALANMIAARAQAVGQDKTANSPFAQEARKWGFSYSGGKPDDVTVVAALVVPHAVA